MKLYTGTGDDGHTGLFGGQRVEKDALRVEAYGTIDELNATLGLVASVCDHDRIGGPLSRLQSRLFDLGSDLACPRPGDPAGDMLAGHRISPDDCRELESWIDDASGDVPEMKSFVLPAGTELAARLHHARTVCRRAERQCITLARNEDIGQDVLIFLNRLSDLLFAWARLANHLDGIEDIPWVSRRQAAKK